MLTHRSPSLLMDLTVLSSSTIPNPSSSTLQIPKAMSAHWSRVSCAVCLQTALQSHCGRPPMRQEGHTPEKVQRRHNDCKEAGIGLRAAQAHRTCNNPLYDCSAAMDMLRHRELKSAH